MNCLILLSILSLLLTNVYASHYTIPRTYFNYFYCITCILNIILILICQFIFYYDSVVAFYKQNYYSFSSILYIHSFIQNIFSLVLFSLKTYNPICYNHFSAYTPPYYLSNLVNYRLSLCRLSMSVFLIVCQLYNQNMFEIYMPQL
jgi:hypothetical protein